MTAAGTSLGTSLGTRLGTSVARPSTKTLAMPLLSAPIVLVPPTGQVT